MCDVETILDQEESATYMQYCDGNVVNKDDATFASKLNVISLRPPGNELIDVFMAARRKFHDFAP